MMEHKLHHVQSLYVALPLGYVSFVHAFCSYAWTFFVTSDTKKGQKRPWCATENHGTHTRAMLYCSMAFKEALHPKKKLVALVAVKL